MSNLRAPLCQGLQTLGLKLSELQIEQLLSYLALIDKWNRVYNLTAVRDPAEMLTHHLLDSLALVKPLQRHLLTCRADESGCGEDMHLLDVGAGAGLPGVVVAICCPDVKVDCVDAVAKKAAFVQQSPLPTPCPLPKPGRCSTADRRCWWTSARPRNGCSWAMCLAA